MTESPNRRPLLIGGAVAALVVVGVLAFGVFGVHTLFIDEEVSEAAPTFTAAPVTDAPDATPEAGAPDADSTDGGPTADAGAGGESTEPAAEAEVVPTTAATGSFVDGDHPTSGTANVLTDGSARRVLRFEEDFATDNGPDLNVYLASSADVGDDFVDLGDLTGNIGSQNYEIPEGVDLAEFDTVVIWCVRFGVAFGSAELG